MSSTPQHLSEFYNLVNKQTGPASSKTQSPAPGSTPVSNGRSSQASARSSDFSSPYRGFTQHSYASASPTMSPVDDHSVPFQAAGGFSHHHQGGAQQHQAPPSRLGYFRRPSVSSLGTVTSTIASASYAAGVQSNHPDLPALIARRDVEETVDSYNGVLAAASRYSEALLKVSAAAAEFGSALEDCARCKGAGSSAEGLLSAGGLHYLVSNHQQILAKSIQRTFEAPVKKQVDQFKAQMASNDETFKQDMKARTRQLKKQEMENARLSRMRVRNLGAYRNSLLELTSQVDDIDRLKYEHFCQAFDLAQDTSTNILTYAASVVRAEVEIYEGIARKGWSGGGLDDLIATCPDPFAPAEEEDEDFDQGTATKSTLAAAGATKNNNSSRKGKFVEAISGFLNPTQATPTTASSSTTIKGSSIQSSSNKASTSTLKQASAEPPKVVRRSTGQGIFSILPSKSILPSYGQSNDNDTSFDSDNEDRLDENNKTLDGKPNGKQQQDASSEFFGGDSDNDSPKSPTTPVKPHRANYSEHETSPLSAGPSLLRSSKRSPGRNLAVAAADSPSSMPPPPTSSSLTSSVNAKSIASPAPGSSVETSKSGRSSHGDGGHHHQLHDHRHEHSDAESDMLGYNQWK